MCLQMVSSYVGMTRPCCAKHWGVQGRHPPAAGQDTELLLDETVALLMDAETVIISAHAHKIAVY